jgi:hypothetical protein
MSHFYKLGVIDVDKFFLSLSKKSEKAECMRLFDLFIFK